MIIEPVRNYVVFTFVEDIVGERFVNDSGGAIVLLSDDKNQTSFPRWGKVIETGPDVSTVSKDEFILIEAGKWTSHFFVEGVRHWKTDEDMILCSADEPGSTY